MSYPFFLVLDFKSAIQHQLKLSWQLWYSKTYTTLFSLLIKVFKIHLFVLRIEI